MSSGNPPKRNSPGAQESFLVFCACFWLCIALILIKAWHCNFPDKFAFDPIFDYLDNIIVLSGNDLLFVCSVGLVAKTVLWLTRNRPVIAKVLSYFLPFYCAGCLLFAIANLRVYEILRTPITYPLLRLGGDLGAMSSSIGRFLTPGLVAAAFCVPLLYFALVISSSRYFLEKIQRARLTQYSCLLVCGIWFFYSHRAFTNWPDTQEDYALGLNPHYLLASSYLKDLLGSASGLTDEFPEEYTSDFQSYSERRADTSPTAGLIRGPKNAIVIVCESVGTQGLSLYGSHFKTWPLLEKEAQDSLVFDNYYSHITNTANSLYSLTLSAYPPLTWRQITEEQPRTPGVTAAQVLKAHGYSTAFFSAGYNHWANQHEFLKGRGFDVLEDAGDLVRAGAPEHDSWGVEDRYLVDRILSFVDEPQHKSKPFYVFSWTQGTHHPYDPGPDWANIDFLKEDDRNGDMAWDFNKYLNAVLELDKQLGRLLSELRKRGLDKDTLVFITGDHGEAFGWPRENNRAHSEMANEENVNVPLLIWSPALFHNAGRSQKFGAHVDLSPTILDLLGFPAPPQWHGRSIFSPDHPPRAYFYGVLNNFYLGVRENKYKYIFNATLGREELYDLEEDRLELRNLALYQPDVCKKLQQRVAAWLHYQNGRR